MLDLLYALYYQDEEEDYRVALACTTVFREEKTNWYGRIFCSVFYKFGKKDAVALSESLTKLMPISGTRLPYERLIN